MTWAKWHRASEGFAAAGGDAERQGNAEEAVRHYLNAAKSEQLALDSVKPIEDGRTYGISAVTLATLWLKAREFDESRNVALTALGTPQLDRAAVPQLRGVLDELLTLAPVSTEESLISSDLTIQGRIIGLGDVRITGQVRAHVQLEGNLILDRGSSFAGTAVARAMIIAGAFVGEILSAEHVDLRTGGSIEGNVYSEVMTVADGARMSGHLDFG